MKLVFHTPLFRSIVRVLLLYCLLEAAGFMATAIWLGFSAYLNSRYALVQVSFHAVLIVFLALAQDFFYIEDSGQRLEKVNIANAVTLLRISMLPSLLFLTIAGHRHPVAPILIPLLALTFLTDLVDGRLSRARKEVTYIGRILDSVSDYSLLVVIATAFCSFALLPPWLLACILFRFAFQAVGMFILILVKKRVEPRPTFLGKVAIATTMVLLAAEALKLVPSNPFTGLFPYIEIAAGSIIMLSLVDKAIFFARYGKKG